MYFFGFSAPGTSSFLSLSFSNKDLFLSSWAVDLPTLLLLYRSEFLFILLFTFGLWILFPPVFPLPLASRSCLFYSTRSLLKKVDLIPQLGSICLGVMVTSWISFFYLSRSRHSLAGRKDSTFQLTCFPNQDSGATARLLNRLDLDRPELHLNLWLWRLGLSLDHDFKMWMVISIPGSSLSIVHRM